MKSKIISALVAVTLTAFTASAGQTLLSPRAKDQIPATGTVVKSPASATSQSGALESPRAISGKIPTVAGRSAKSASAPCAVIGSPRHVELFGNACCKVAKASCAEARDCCK